MIKTSHQLHSINPETERLGGEKELHKARLESFNSWVPTYSISHGTDKSWSLKTPCFSSLGYTWVFCFALQDFFFFSQLNQLSLPVYLKLHLWFFWKVTLAFLDNSPYDNFCIVESFIKNKQTNKTVRRNAFSYWWTHSAAAAAKSLQSCPTMWDSIDGSPLGSSVPGIHSTRVQRKYSAQKNSSFWSWRKGKAWDDCVSLSCICRSYFSPRHTWPLGSGPSCFLRNVSRVFPLSILP